MTTGEFNAQMDRMRGCFGQEAYENVERIAMIWKAVKELNDLSFGCIVDHFVSTARKAPLPVDFMDAVAAESKKGSGAYSKLRSGIKCITCQDVGSISAWRRGYDFKHSTTYSFRCPMRCGSSLKLSTHIMQWDDGLVKDYLPCLGMTKTNHDIWQEHHVELYGFPESDRSRIDSRSQFGSTGVENENQSQLAAADLIQEPSQDASLNKSESPGLDFGPEPDPR